MTEGENSPTPSTTKPKKTASETGKGGGSYLNASMIGPRGREFQVVGASWEENFAHDALIPCLHLGADTEEGEDILFKLTTRGNNAAIDAAGAGGEDLSPVIGATIYVQVVPVHARDGTVKMSLQIAELTRDGKSVWTATKA